MSRPPKAVVVPVYLQRPNPILRIFGGPNSAVPGAGGAAAAADDGGDMALEKRSAEALRLALEKLVLPHDTLILLLLHPPPPNESEALPGSRERTCLIPDHANPRSSWLPCDSSRSQCAPFCLGGLTAGPAVLPRRRSVFVSAGAERLKQSEEEMQKCLRRQLRTQIDVASAQNVRQGSCPWDTRAFLLLPQLRNPGWSPCLGGP